MDTGAELVTQPFREVIERGKVAIENAGNQPLMMLEAQRLVKAAERSLGRIETSCNRLYGEYGPCFLNALKENDEITELRRQLTDLLWDFEDYIEAETFEAEKFQELQVLIREIAPKIYNILITMKLENYDHFQPRLSPPLTPHPHSLTFNQKSQPHSVPLVHSAGDTASISQSDMTSVVDFPNVQDATDQLRGLLSQRPLTSVETYYRDNATALLERDGDGMHSTHRKTLASPSRPLPLELWGHHVTPHREIVKVDDQSPVEYGSAGRDPNVYRTESPVDPAILPMSFDIRRHSPRGTSLQSSSIMTASHELDTDTSSNYRHSGSSMISDLVHTPTSLLRSRETTISSTIQEEEAFVEGSKPNYLPSLLVRPPFPQGLETVFDDGLANQSHVDDMDRQYEATRRPLWQPPDSPLPPPPLRRRYGNSHIVEPVSGPERPVSPMHFDPSAQNPFAQVVSDAGLISVEAERHAEAIGAHEVDDIERALSQKDREIGPESSFHRYKGICEGARAVCCGEAGVRKANKSGFASNTLVARCTGCLLELDLSQIEADIDKQDKGNFHKNGIDYRLRFLQKSHLPAKRVDDILYACVFCVQAGRTMDESDATVFTSSKALLSHLAHHPRPLPHVPGVVVLEADDVPVRLRNDFDICFTEAAAAHPAQVNVSRIKAKAKGVARDQCRRLHGQRLLYDRSPALEICHGSRVTGIEWPEKYNGEWMLAWHDGMRGSVPASIINLKPPPSEDIRMKGSSLIRAKSRWKFQQKEKEKDNSLWLRFDKNETITNISYAHADFWCWSGTNTKGKWGIFPKVFLEPSTIQQSGTDSADRSSNSTDETNKASSRFKFSSKKRASGRPSSMATSGSSGPESVGAQNFSIFSNGG